MKSKRREAGMSLVDLIASLTLLSVGLLAYYQGVFHSVRLGEQTRANDDIAVALRNTLSRLQAEDFEDIVTLYDVGSGQEDFFVNGGGEIVFVQPAEVIATGTLEFFLEEDNIPKVFGMPSDSLDLDADGTIESGVISDYKALPVLITLQTDRPLGSYTRTFPVILAE